MSVELVGGPYDGRRVPYMGPAIDMPDSQPVSVFALEDLDDYRPSFKTVRYVRARCLDGSVVYVLEHVYRALTAY